MLAGKQRLLMAFGSLCVTNFVCALDTTSLGVPLPVIVSDLHGTSLEGFWTGTSFLLTSTVSQPIFTSLSQIFGRKSMLLIALTFFMVGSVVCALAPGFPTFLSGRSFQGIGGGGIMSLIYVTVTDVVDLRDRGKWFGTVTMTAGVGTVVGPLIGGGLARPRLWRVLFWVNVPICAVAYVSIIFGLKLQKPEGSVLQKIARVDWLGSSLFIFSLTAVLMSLSWGGTVFSWGQWELILPLIAGIFGLVVFMLWSAQPRKEAILPKSMFMTSTALATHLGTAVHGMILWCSLYYMPFYFEAVKGYSPLISGVAQLPYSLTYGPLSASIGFKISQKGTYRWAIESGWIILAIGVGHMLNLDESTSIYSWIPKEVLVGIALGILSPAMNCATQASTSRAYRPHAAGVFVFFRTFGQTVGMVIGGTVFQNALKRKLESYPLLATDVLAYSKDALAMVQIVKDMPHSTQRSEIIESFEAAVRMIWVPMLAFVVFAGGIALIFTRDYPLDFRSETEQPRNINTGQGSTTDFSLPDLEGLGPIDTDFIGRINV